MPRSPVCVDANIVVTIVAPEVQRPLALSLWRSWLKQDREIVAPRLLAYEVTSALWRKVRRDVLTLEEARHAVQAALRMGVTILDPPGLSEQAFELAARFQRPAAYDAHYLALADHLECPFWTADERLYNAIRTDFPHIHWLGEHRSEESA
jgi:predicted nucleic acid-binding protein